MRVIDLRSIPPHLWVPAVNDLSRLQSFPNSGFNSGKPLPKRRFNAGKPVRDAKLKLALVETVVLQVLLDFGKLGR
jgi:hypothetical protein